jgi:hypothetical protein
MNETNPTIEFGIAGVERHSDFVEIIGRCHQGPIRVGDRFTAAYKKEVVRTPDGGIQEGARFDQRSVDLKVTQILAYQTVLEEIDSGLTAKLRVIGVADRLELADILGVSNDLH